MDFIVDLPPSGLRQATNILVITDRLSKSVIFEPMKEITTEATAETLLSGLIRHHGLPTAIVSDRGVQFVSLVWKQICDLLRIKRRLSTAYHPETDGATERANQELEVYLRAYVSYEQDDWERNLFAAMMAINNRTATSIGLTPFFFTHGYNIDPIVVNETLREDDKSPIAKGEAFVKRIQEATETAQAAMAVAQEQQESQTNKDRQPADHFQTGDKVWLRLRNIKTDRISKKLDWLNAKYEIIEAIGTHSYRLDTPPGIHNVFHTSLLKRAATDPLPSQTKDDYQPPAVISQEGEEEWEIERILKERKTKQGRKLLVKWVGYSKPTWEPEQNLQDTEALIQFDARERRGVLSRVANPT